jgi:hypothetical protein
MKRLLIIVFLFSLASCGNSVSYKTHPNYGLRAPRTIAILPVTSKNKKITSDARRLLRTVVARKLIEKNYHVVSLDEVDRRYIKYGSEQLEAMEPARLAGLMKADAVLYTTITKWDENSLATYASLKVGVGFKLFSKDGLRLWRAAYDTKESDIRLDRTQVELAVLKVYEPRIQRLVDTSFITLPNTFDKDERKEFFKWLP